MITTSPPESLFNIQWVYHNERFLKLIGRTATEAEPRGSIRVCKVYVVFFFRLFRSFFRLDGRETPYGGMSYPFPPSPSSPI